MYIISSLAQFQAKIGAAPGTLAVEGNRAVFRLFPIRGRCRC
jgi:hypothetical protein